MHRVHKIVLSVAMAAVSAGAVRYALAQTALTATTNSAEFFGGDKVQSMAADVLAKAKASANGSASATFATYPGHFLNVTARLKSGGGEFHTHYNDIFVVLDGEATEVTGGTIPDMVMDATTGEGHGATIVGGTPHKLKKGDVLHISAGTPHQTIMEPGKSFTAMVIKVHQD